jgi:hypothetical protein
MERTSPRVGTSRKLLARRNARSPIGRRDPLCFGLREFSSETNLNSIVFFNPVNFVNFDISFESKIFMEEGDFLDVEDFVCLLNQQRGEKELLKKAERVLNGTTEQEAKLASLELEYPKIRRKETRKIRKKESKDILLRKGILLTVGTVAIGVLTYSFIQNNTPQIIHFSLPHYPIDYTIFYY